ncbi:Uncharacterised protein [uncultured archaeon]|nr:Uncharacterised protein [uncultured archaeon]
MGSAVRILPSRLFMALAFVSLALSVLAPFAESFGSTDNVLGISIIPEKTLYLKGKDQKIVLSIAPVRYSGAIQEVPVTLTKTGPSGRRETIDIPANPVPVGTPAAPLSFTAEMGIDGMTEPGVYVFTVSVPVQPGETIAIDNSGSAAVQVADNRGSAVPEIPVPLAAIAFTAIIAILRKAKKSVQDAQL